MNKFLIFPSIFTIYFPIASKSWLHLDFYSIHIAHDATGILTAEYCHLL